MRWAKSFWARDHGDAARVWSGSKGARLAVYRAMWGKSDNSISVKVTPQKRCDAMHRFSHLYIGPAEQPNSNIIQGNGAATPNFQGFEFRSTLADRANAKSISRRILIRRRSDEAGLGVANTILKLQVGRRKARKMMNFVQNDRNVGVFGDIVFAQFPKLTQSSWTDEKRI